MWAIISGWVTKTGVSWLASNWKLTLAGVLTLAFAGMAWAWQGARDDYRDMSTIAQGLEDDLLAVQDSLVRERSAAEAARKASIEWSQEAADRGRELKAAIDREGETNEAFSSCMSMRWSDGLIDRLPK